MAEQIALIVIVDILAILGIAVGIIYIVLLVKNKVPNKFEGRNRK